MVNITISVPITKDHDRFLKDRVKSGEEAWLSLERARENVRAGRIYSGDLDKLAKKPCD
jgi:hypothetical protein